MSENRLPEFGTVEDLVDFFDTHDMGKYWDEMPEAHFDVDIQKHTFLVAVDEELMKKLAEVAKNRQTSTGALVKSWLEEKIAQAA
jgi:hypothetical protein